VPRTLAWGNLSAGDLKNAVHLFAGGYNHRYTLHMKTAVSIPDSLYNEAERLAKGLRLSRSSLYARALERFVQEARSQHVTASLNEVYGKGPQGDEFVEVAAKRVLEGEDW